MSEKGCKVVAIIIARGGSTGIPRKNIKLLGGKPLINWTIQAAKDTKCVDRVFVSTEDTEIAEVSQWAGAEVLTRPQELAGGEVQSSEVFLFSLRQMRVEYNIFPETVILLMPTQPFRTSQHIDEAYKLYRGHGSVIGVKRDYRFHWEQVSDRKCRPVYQPPPNLRLGRQWIDEDEWLLEETGSLYIVGAEAMSLYKHYWLKPHIFYVLPEEAAMQIDTPYDMWLAEKYLEYLKEN